MNRCTFGTQLRLALAAAFSLCAAVPMGAAERAEVQPSADPARSVLAPLAPRSLLLDGAAADGLMVVVGERGHILVSSDDGKSWRQSNAPTRATLTAVFLLNRKLGWAVGHDATILRTRDGGETWEKTYSAPKEERPFLDVWFADADHGLAIGAYGLFMRSSDGGTSWKQESIALVPSGGAPEGPAQEAGESDVSESPSPEGEESMEDEGVEEPDALNEAGDLHLNAIARAESGRLYIAAESGTILRSEDGGVTWATLPSPYEGSLFGVLPLEGDAVMVFGLRGHLFRSEDAGQVWTAIESATAAMLTDGRRLSGGRIAITGLGGALLVSADGGRSFELRQQPNRQGLSSLLEGKDGTIVLVGELGVNTVSLSN